MMPMAIYHLHIKVISRSTGKSAVASAAYRHAAKMFDERENRSWNYQKKNDVLHSEISIPENAPEWIKEIIANNTVNKSSEIIWNAVENIEKRNDAQLAREVEFSLPIELNKDQSLILARDFIRDQFVQLGMIADWSIHWDEGNPHVHVMLSMRSLDQNGFGLKVRDWNRKELLQNYREKWAEYANFHLQMHEHNVRIDHRSYEHQGIELVPSIHEGKAVIDMNHRGIHTNIRDEADSIRRENLARICSNPKVLLKKITSQYDDFTLRQVGQELGRYINDKGRFTINQKEALAQSPFQNLTQELNNANTLTPDLVAKILSSIEQHESVFNDRDLAKAISAYTDNADMFAQAVIEVKASPDLMPLGPGDDGRERFTTRTMFDLENEIQKKVDILRDTTHLKFSNHTINNILEGYQNRTNKHFTDEQITAIKHILQPSSISCVVGRAGTGKSFSLGAAKEVWESQGLKVYGIALSGIAADGLAKDAAIDSRTIDSFRYAIQNGKIILNNRSVVVMDEAGMTDSHSMLFVLNTIRDARAKLVLVGDHAQIQPVGPGASFRALLERLDFVELQTVYRQKYQWQREATVTFSAGNVLKAIAAYDDNNCVYIDNNRCMAMAALSKEWFHSRETNLKDISQYLIISHRNEDVHQLNQLIRENRVKLREIAEGCHVQTKLGILKISQGDRILFLKNDRGLGVSNGRFATIKTVNFTDAGKVISFNVSLDGSGKEVSINPQNYNDFTLGYAATVHKVQGMTVDHAFVYAGGMGWNRHLTYVAMSRHRETCHLYADQETHENKKVLTKNLGRLGIKDSLLDYPLAFAERRGVDTSRLLKLLPKHLAKRLTLLKEQLVQRHEQRMNPQRFLRLQKEKQNTENIAKKIKKTREDARAVAAYTDTNRNVGITWQSLQSKLHELGFDKISYEPEEFVIIAGTREYQAFQESLKERNALACPIIKEPERYQKAVELHSLDLSKLEVQAENHHCLQRVEAYIALQQSGKVVRRDQQAALISANIKPHYPHLKSLSVNTKAFQQEAISHLRRQLFTKLTIQEREIFRIVEKYREKSQESGAYYAKYIKSNTDKILARRHATKFEQLGLERDELAYKIMQNRATYDKALDFYQIGLAIPHFQITPTPEQCQQADARWYKLQNYAARHEFRQRMQKYIEACATVSLSTRLNLAHEIMQNTKSHFAAMKQLGIDTGDGLFLQISRDSKRHAQVEAYKKLDLVDRIGFRLAERYVDAKRANGAAWSELLNSKKSALMDDIAFAKMTPFATKYTKTRNKFANLLKQNASKCHAGLSYFGISADEINQQSYIHQCQLRVTKFTETTDPLMRGQIALEIIQDTKGHYKAMLENGITWKCIYHFARIAERKNLFSHVSIDEKRLLRLVEKYRTISRQVGKLYGDLNSQKKTNSHLPKMHYDNKMRFLVAKRDHLADSIMSLKANVMMATVTGNARTVIDTYMEKNRFSWEKIAKHANQHMKKQQEVLLYREDYTASLLQLSTITDSNNISDREKMFSRLIDWLADRQDRNIDALTQKILVNGKSYEAILQTTGISLTELNQQQSRIKLLKESLGQWQALVNQQKRIIASSQDILSREDKSRIIAVLKIVRETTAIKSTLGERYLREHRGINRELSTETFRYHPNLKNWVTGSFHPALIVIARDKSNQICGMQAIFLNPETANKADLGNNTKLSRGFTSEGGLVHRGLHNDKVAFAEGPETALSIAEAKPDWSVYVTFGVRNFEKVALKTKKNSIVICADNDGPHSGTQKSVEETAQNLAKKGIDVYVAMPNKPLGNKKWDFNDALLNQSINQISENLEQATLNQQGISEIRLETQVLNTTAAITSPNNMTAPQVAISSLMDMYDMKSIAKYFVELEIQQKELAHTIQISRVNDPKLSKAMLAKAIKLGKDISEFAAHAMKNPDVAYELQQVKSTRPASLAKRGGYVAIYQRFTDGEFLPEDLDSVLTQIRNKASEHSKTQRNNRDRGGRTH
jgi:Ti-type conjugative transfer relaxase TraA